MKSNHAKSQKAKTLKILGNFFLAIAILILAKILLPVVLEEVKFLVNSIKNVSYVIDDGLSEIDSKKSDSKILTPPNTKYSIIIPKIGAVAPVVESVDPLNKNAYLSALRNGVAHARGTPNPGVAGNTYIFAHSTDAFYNVTSYNAVFYLLGKLEKEDEIVVYYNNAKYIYSVDKKIVVSATDTKYLKTLEQGVDTLTLQTCYPPGTTLKRLVVTAHLTETVSDSIEN